MTRLGGSRTGFGGSGGGESVSFPDQTGEDFLGRPKKSELGELSGAMMTAMAGGEIVAGLGRGGRREGEGGTGVAPSPALPRYVKGDPITSVYVLSTPRKLLIFLLFWFCFLGVSQFPEVIPIVCFSLGLCVMGWVVCCVSIFSLRFSSLIPG